MLCTTIIPVRYDKDGAPVYGVTTLTAEEQEQRIKNKHIFLIPEENALKAAELLRSAGYMQ